jgi:serine/threonine-protein kinase
MPARADQAVPERPFLGRYQAVRQLGEGGMATVWLAREQGAERLAVVKCIHARLATHPPTREAFRREIDFMRRFRHPFAVQLYDASLTDPAGPCLAMEYVQGVPLDELVGQQGPLPADRVGFLLGQLCAVLQALHTMGYIHADIKPANIMLLAAGTAEESIKVLDFGLARKQVGLTDTPYIQLEKITDNAFGTPEYMSPQRLRREPLDPRDDLYSVGILLYVLLTGRIPFASPSLERLMQAHSEDAPPSFAELGVTGIPPGIEQAVQWCLAKALDDRPPTARDLALAYQEALGVQIWDDAAMAEGELQHEDSNAIPKSDDEIVHRLEAWMPEQIAVMKLRGFLDDLGAQVTESVPGLIRVFLKRLRETPQAAAPTGLLAWLGFAKKPEPETDLIEMEVHMEPHASQRSNHLQITLRARVISEQRPADWKEWCEKTITALSGYLMAKRS